MFTPEYWDARYSATEKVWSGKPNQRLVEQAADLPPGRALEVGSGEGADAIWLAARGWEVLGVDVSQVALDRSAARAAAKGPDIAGRLRWQQADVLSWEPEPARYDLVSAQFMHLPRPSLRVLHHRLAAAVRPGGSLIVVGHHPTDMETFGHGWRAGMLFTADDVIAALDPDDWRIAAPTAPERQAIGPDGEPMNLRDAVLHAVRLPAPPQPAPGAAPTG
jgi:SAM-dependent methyltransferase